MSWTIVYDAKAIKDLARLPSRDAKRVAGRIRELTGDQRGLDIKKLKDDTRSRLRVGDYRVMFRPDPHAKHFRVLQIVRRSERTYRVLAWLALWGIG